MLGCCGHHVADSFDERYNRAPTEITQEDWGHEIVLAQNDKTEDLKTEN